VVLSQYQEDAAAYKFGIDEFSPDDSNNIYVAGYDPVSNNPVAYHLNLPSVLSPVRLIGGAGGVIVSGVGDYMAVIDKEQRATWIKGLENSIKGSEILGSPARTSDLSKLNLLTQGQIPFQLLSRAELCEYAEFAISFSSLEQTRLNEWQTIGGGIDMLWLTPKKGVEEIRYEEYAEVGHRQVAKTNYHQIILRCDCGTETRMQLDFSEEYVLGRSLVRFPSDGILVCSGCDRSHNLDAITTFLEELLGADFIDANLPTA
jgi:hypothetical protein